ncbi:hypothetical protein BGZ94_003929 [Podila epigama]|nr:hypothetical protein BGZ94_003929 [Podila epigama]
MAEPQHFQGHSGYSPSSRAMSSTGYPSPGTMSVGLPVDPYRSAYSHQQLQQYHQHQQQYQHQQLLNQQQQQPYSPYLSQMPNHGGSSPAIVPYDDMASSYGSRYSLSSIQQPNHYAMYPLSPQDSSHALTVTTAQQQHSPQQMSKQTLPRRASSIDMTSHSNSPPSLHSATLLSPQTQRPGSKAASTSTGSRRVQSEEEEEEENAQILLKASRSGSRSGTNGHPGGGKETRKRKNKKITENWKGGNKGSMKDTKHSDLDNEDDDDDEEGQERGADRRRDGKRCFCCTRRLCVYLTFIFALCLGVALFFLVPRAPAISYLSVAPVGEPVFTHNRMQENFTLQMRVDSSDNYLPIKLNSIDLTVWLKIDQTKIGHNNDLPSSVTIQPRIVQTISMPMAFDFTSLKVDTNADSTLQELINACTPVPEGSDQSVRRLSLTFGGKMHVWGLAWVWKPQFSFNVGNMPCPINAWADSAPPIAPVAPPPPPPPPPATSASTNSSATPSLSNTSSSGTHSSVLPTGVNPVTTPTATVRP